jgi:predicted HicB family RNase H-like nuclease
MQNKINLLKPFTKFSCGPYKGKTVEQIWDFQFLRRFQILIRDDKSHHFYDPEFEIYREQANQVGADEKRFLKKKVNRLIRDFLHKKRHLLARSKRRLKLQKRRQKKRQKKLNNTIQNNLSARTDNWLKDKTNSYFKEIKPLGGA